MEIKRCTKTFRTGVRGVSVGALLPAGHDLVAKFPQFFEPVEDYVARRFPEHAPKPASAHTEAPAEPKPAARKTTARKPAARKGA